MGPEQQHALDHARPLPAGAAVSTPGAVARFLGVPAWTTSDGRLYRVVVVWRGTLTQLRRGLLWADVAVPGDGIPDPAEPGAVYWEAEGVCLYPVGGVVLCGAYEDVRETLDTPGRLGRLLAATAGRGPAPALDPPESPP